MTSQDDHRTVEAPARDAHSPATLSGPDLSDRHGEELRNLGYIVISPEGPKDGGDFGPHTSGTTTAGFREALEYAKGVNRDVFVVGGTRSGPGPDSEPVVYEFQETLEVPWFQDFDLRGSSSYIIKCVGDGDAVVLDSSMNCQYHFGLVWSDGHGAALRVKPRTEGPDDMTTFVASEVEWAALVTHGVVDDEDTGSGLVLDASEAAITQSKFEGEETNTQDIGLALTNDGGRGGPIANNWIQVRFLNQGHATGNCTNLQVGDPGSTNVSNNRIDTALTVPRGVYFDENRGFVSPEGFTVPDDAIGAEIHGRNNMITLSGTGERESGKDLVFGESASGNLVFALSLANGITNEAVASTNRVISADPNGLHVDTPPVPASGDPVTNTTPVPVEVLFSTAGDVSAWSLSSGTDDDITVKESPSAGQTVTLRPGESIALEYDVQPIWHWRGIY